MWLCDEDHKNQNDPLYPSKKNVTKAIQDTLAKCEKSGESDAIWFSYSGHGTNQQCADAEDDGTAEFICTLDGHISDKWLKTEFCDKLPHNDEAFVMFDACRSGTALDLPFKFKKGSRGFIRESDTREKKCSRRIGST